MKRQCDCGNCQVLLHFKILRFNYVLNKNVPLFWKLGFTRFVLRSYHVFLRISTCRPTISPSTVCCVPLSFDTYLLGFYFVSIFATVVVEFSKHTGQVPFWAKDHYVSIRFVTLRFQNIVKCSSWNVTVWLGLDTLMYTPHLIVYT